ncbi:S9 family peptidase [Sphingomonas sp.]|uniref:S9 family peptidase n=1 Tax=Sphingomonas sp. TaxID=28214 RepID=UPI0025CC9E1B|nr:S9 family peptidase [Sphingomonas sp.]
MTLPTPPVAARRPNEYTRHGVTISDDWAWLRDQGYPEVTDEEVLSYLKAENAYFEAVMAPHKGLVDTLFEEMKGRIKEDLSSVPAPDGRFEYWWAYKPGEQYRRWYRKGRETGTEELIFDEVAAAEGHDYFRLGAIVTSPDYKLLATLVDDDGSERFKLRIRDIASGKDIETITEVAIGAPVWAADSKGVAFTEVNEHWRSDKAKYHRLGDDPANAVTLYEETLDKGFSVGLGKSQDDSLIFIATGDNTSSEVRFVPAADPTAAPVLIAARRPNIEYHTDAAHGRLWIVTNDAHINFRLVSAAVETPAEWREEIAGSDRVYLRGAASYRDHLALTTREDGLDRLVLRTYAGDERAIPFDEASYSADFAGNADFAPAAYRLSYSSMVTPPTVYDFHPADDRLETLRVLEIPSGHDPADYVIDRRLIRARDGAMVPVSIVRRAGSKLDGAGRLFLYGYGAYGIAIPPGFSPTRLSLVDRGFAYAIAHIRGGDDLGHGWYLDGKLQRRPNSFNDFVDVARGLAELGYARPGRIAAQGGSAGGELMGAVANQAPELWGAIVADVPFVDVLNTMLDDTLPLTPGEWPEWGNPIEDKAAFDLIRGYSPYDNVAAQAYPPLLITGGLNDPRVTYWEPAKWAAKLRATKTGDNMLLLKINMGAGHGGKSGRWDALRENAEAYAFVLTQMGE